MKELEYKKLNLDEINEDLFKDFNRYQKVSKCWRKVEDKWVLKDIEFTEEWTADEYRFLAKCLQNTVNTGGVVYGAFNGGSLAGFVSVENTFFGSQKEYLQLSSIHVTFEGRGMGIGRRLFDLAVNSARDMGAKKLYISAHSSEESQAFYKKLGCVEAMEYNKKLVDDEPCDCQLEFEL